MALIHLGPMASDVRGSMGGSVFSRNRSGIYIRRRVVPVNPQTGPQSEARNRISDLQALFRDVLTADQRAMWSALAAGSTAKNKVGLAITLTAQNMYIKVNTLKLRCGLGAMHVAPAPPVGCDAPEVTVLGDTGGVKITACTPAIVTDECFYVQVGLAVNQTVQYYKGPWPISWESTAPSRRPIRSSPGRSARSANVITTATASSAPSVAYPITSPATWTSRSDVMQSSLLAALHFAATPRPPAQSLLLGGTFQHPWRCIMSPSLSLKSLLDSLNAILDGVIAANPTQPWIQVVHAVVHLVDYLVTNHAEELDATSATPPPKQLTRLSIRTCATSRFNFRTHQDFARTRRWLNVEDGPP